MAFHTNCNDGGKVENEQIVARRNYNSVAHHGNS